MEVMFYKIDRNRKHVRVTIYDPFKHFEFGTTMPVIKCLEAADEFMKRCGAEFCRVTITRNNIPKTIYLLNQ